MVAGSSHLDGPAMGAQTFTGCSPRAISWCPRAGGQDEAPQHRTLHQATQACFKVSFPWKSITFCLVSLKRYFSRLWAPSQLV